VHATPRSDLLNAPKGPPRLSVLRESSRFADPPEGAEGRLRPPRILECAGFPGISQAPRTGQVALPPAAGNLDLCRASAEWSCAALDDQNWHTPERRPTCRGIPALEKSFFFQPSRETLSRSSPRPPCVAASACPSAGKRGRTSLVIEQTRLMSLPDGIGIVHVPRDAEMRRPSARARARANDTCTAAAAVDRRRNPRRVLWPDSHRALPVKHEWAVKQAAGTRICFLLLTCLNRILPTVTFAGL